MQKNVSLSDRSSFHIGGRAKRFFEVKNKAELRQAINFAIKNKLPWQLVGSMTNILLPDTDLELVIQLIPSGEPLNFTAGRLELWAGETVAQIAWQTIKQGYQGLESFASLPGTFGGAIWNNAHYQNDFISDKLLAVEYLNLDTLQPETKTKAELDFGYDHSWFQTNPSVILTATFQLEPAANPQDVAEKSVQATAHRRATQPLGESCAGCYWQNPANTAALKKRFPEFAHRSQIPAGFLIEQAGLKNAQVGDAQVSDKHAAFIINQGSATSHDVQRLATLIKQKIKAEFDIDLQEEVQIIAAK